MSAGERFFVDTNVLLYSLDPIDRGKQRSAQRWLAALWEEVSGSLSWQVLHEFYVNAIRKVGVPKTKARATPVLCSALQEGRLTIGRRIPSCPTRTKTECP
jgi:predicted nucleic acid-binding protein